MATTTTVPAPDAAGVPAVPASPAGVPDGSAAVSDAPAAAGAERAASV